MHTFLVREPIVDQSNNTYGYEFLYDQHTPTTESQADRRAASTIENFLTQINSQKILEGKTAFLTFTPELILKNVPKIFSPQKLVIQIDDSTVVHPFAVNLLRRYSQQGYKIALKGLGFSNRYFSILEHIDIIKIDFAASSVSSISNAVKICEGFGKHIVAYNINTKESYELASSLNIPLYQGMYVAEIIPTQIASLSHLPHNFFQLMIEVTKDEPDIALIDELISRDVSLTFSLLKLVNSAYFALRNRVKSVQQALIVLGLGQLKQWIYLLSFKQKDAHVPVELIKKSLFRAHFCQSLIELVSEPPVSKSEAYLLGMFSTLDALMGMPIEQALEELDLSTEITEALIHQSGPCSTLYLLILSYEKADWKKMSKLAEELDIPTSVIGQKYIDCIELVNNIWSSLTESQFEEEEEGLQVEQQNNQQE